MRGRTVKRVIGVCMPLLVMLACGFMASGAFALPEGRHYEMVSPAYKGGYGTNLILGVASAGQSEGEKVAFTSLGIFADAPSSQTFITYLATRSVLGWSTSPLMIPSMRTLSSPSAAIDVSPSLDSALFLGSPESYTGLSSRGSLEQYREEYLVRRFGATETPLVVDMPLTGLEGGPLNLAGEIESTSPDMCHVVFGVARGGIGEPLLPEARGDAEQVYELAAGRSVVGCGGEAPSLRLVSVGNEDGPNGEPEPVNPSCPAYTGSSSENDLFNAVSANGQEIFFTSTNVSGTPCDHGVYTTATGGYEPANPSVLFVRLNGERTVRVSTPVEADCEASAPCHNALEAAKQGTPFTGQQRAEFAGANQEGTRVFFTTAQPLVTGDAEFTCEEKSGGLGEFSSHAECEAGAQTIGGAWKRFGDDLYMATIGCPTATSGCEPSEREVTSLVQISHPASVGARESGEVDDAAPMMGVVVSPGGQRVYFVARGLLTEGANREGHAPVRGADNLYVYDVDRHLTSFIAELCSGRVASGEETDHSCPGGEDSWVGSQQPLEAQTTRDGRFLVFTSFGQLVPGDTDTARDVYRYDAQTGALDRVSVGSGGADANGNNDSYDAELPSNAAASATTYSKYEMGFRSIADDGSRIVFGTADPLSPKAVNGLVNAYEWHEPEGSTRQGDIALVSNGTDEQAVGTSSYPAVITPSGRDLFFMTVQGLLPQDTDGASDIYDARIGEGFPPEPAPRQPCSADACQGPLSQPAPSLVPGSAVQAAGENALPAKTPVVKGKAKSTRRRCRRGRAHKRHGRCVKQSRKRVRTSGVSARRRGGRQ